MTDAKQILRLYRRQAKTFERWTNDLLSCAYLLWKKSRELGPAHFESWLQTNCPEIDWALAMEMIRQLHETEAGRQLVSSLENPTTL